MLRRLVFVLLFLILAANAFFHLMPALPEETGTISVLFCPGCKDEFLSLLTHDEITCLLYDVDDEDILKQLNGTHTFVFEDNALPDFPSVPSRGLMHHKFCIFDDTVITGSTNPTHFGLTRNDNNILVLESPTLAARYREEFNDIATRTKASDPKTTRTTRVNVSGTVVELYMCPQDACEQAILRTLQAAEQSVHFMTFTFTSDPLGEILITLHERGIHVEGVFEKRQQSQWSEYENLLAWELPVLLDNNPGTMHHKVFIVDNRTVITGSYNPTKAANERNDENLLIIHDAAIAQQYLSEYARVLAATRS